MSKREDIRQLQCDIGTLAGRTSSRDDELQDEVAQLRALAGEFCHTSSAHLKRIAALEERLVTTKLPAPEHPTTDATRLLALEARARSSAERIDDLMVQVERLTERSVHETVGRHDQTLELHAERLGDATKRFVKLEDRQDGHGTDIMRLFEHWREHDQRIRVALDEMHRLSGLVAKLETQAAYNKQAAAVNVNELDRVAANLETLRLATLERFKAVESAAPGDCGMFDQKLVERVTALESRDDRFDALENRVVLALDKHDERDRTTVTWSKLNPRLDKVEAFIATASYDAQRKHRLRNDDEIAALTGRVAALELELERLAEGCSDVSRVTADVDDRLERHLDKHRKDPPAEPESGVPPQFDWIKPCVLVNWFVDGEKQECMIDSEPFWWVNRGAWAVKLACKDGKKDAPCQELVKAEMDVPFRVKPSPPKS